MQSPLPAGRNGPSWCLWAHSQDFISHHSWGGLGPPASTGMKEMDQGCTPVLPSSAYGCGQALSAQDTACTLTAQFLGYVKSEFGNFLVPIVQREEVW